MVETEEAPTFAAFAARERSATRSEFLARHRAPFLLQLTAAGERRRVFSTGPMLSHERADAIGAVARCLIFPLAKRPGNPFPEMITIGRAPNNDIVLAHASISKFHAFARESAAGWSIVDAGSTNGTVAGGERLFARESVAVDPDRAQLLRFGEIVCQLVSPEILWDFLAALETAAAVA